MKETKRNSFTFYRSFYEAIKELPEANQLKIYQSIAKYSLEFVEPKSLKGIDKTVWVLVEPFLSSNINKFKNGLKPKEKLQKSKPEANNKQTRSKAQGNKDKDKKEDKNKDNNKEVKKKNGQYKNVLLTESEYNKLVDRFGQDVAKNKIIEMDEAIELKGYKYKSHYLAILKWSKNDTDQNKGVTEGNLRVLKEMYPDEYAKMEGKWKK